jgi:hypothetical protein
MTCPMPSKADRLIILNWKYQPIPSSRSALILR